ncbi:hypothetical protein BFP97_06535 [Roseivirga sp. 4D4]|uniref:hypothetical protein n=1 Tax=Roseivirga sp. 4D4 TaxID=1889784 RepID=UPI000852A934|nr:hypothetical protein [Roseivirga sp. 4D4]OEK01187.1 hypothetical protein BFP97_06535 [Roseivirga sp. 4D4]
MHKTFALALFFLVVLPNTPQIDHLDLEGKWKEVKRKWVTGRERDAWGDLFKPLYEVRFDLKKKKAHIRYAGVVNRDSDMLIQNDSLLFFDNTRFVIKELSSNKMVLKEWPVENPEDPTAKLLFFDAVKE